MKKYLKVKKNYLLLLAGFVWGIAGVNILKIGIENHSKFFNGTNLFMSLIVYGLFTFLVFKKMVNKHTKRIVQYEEEHVLFIKFFDVKGFCIMAFMMTFGILLRKSGLAPERFIAVFYSGLGLSLFTAGVLFLIKFINIMRRGENYASNYGNLI